MNLIRYLHSSSTKLSDFSHVVIGGGIIGTAIAAELQKVGHNVCLLEKNSNLGMETTSRNSEVIHAGIYYPKESLKSKFCIEGKDLIYNALQKGIFTTEQVPAKKCGKLIMAYDEEESSYLNETHRFTNEQVGVETNFITQAKLKQQYPHLYGVSALDSPSTGIISVHEYLLFHQAQFENHEGTIALNTEVNGLEYNASSSSYRIHTVSNGEEFEITSDNVINSGGLFAAKIANMLLPKDRHYIPFFGKGTYFSYSPKKSLGKFTDKLVYPCPNPNASSLGTHLTFDMGGQVKFGPDLEWLDTTNADEIDYTPSYQNLDAAYKAVRRYFPSLQDGELSPSYTGVRPKINSLSDSKKKFADFVIKEEQGFPGFINLVGMESPGVTGAWAIGKYVTKMF